MNKKWDEYMKEEYYQIGEVVKLQEYLKIPFIFIQKADFSAS